MSSTEINTELQTFCKSITGSDPITVRYQTEPWARTNYCFANVNRKIGESGGEGQLGWQFGQIPIGTTPGVIIAVHHQVWKSPSGELIDITPCVASTLRSGQGLFFLPDDAATLPRPFGYEIGVSRPKKVYPLATTAKVKKIVEATRLEERQYWETVSGMLA